MSRRVIRMMSRPSHTESPAYQHSSGSKSWQQPKQLEPDSYCALDFGTSNSVLAVRTAEGQPRLFRDKSVLLFADDSLPHYEVGERALSVYLARGRRGRLLRSLKSLLPHKSFEGSLLGGSWWTLESLLTLLMERFRESAEVQIGRRLRGVVLGKPARFAIAEEDERLAEMRLRRAAAAAGFEDIRLVPEPVAAAAAYRMSLGKSETTLVADLGAGTSDFSIACLEPIFSGAAIDSQILATSAIRTGGDDIDGTIMWHKASAYFGRGTKYLADHKWLEVPVRIFRDLCYRERLPFLRGGRSREDLDIFIRRSPHNEGLIRLARLIDYDLGYSLFDSIETAKIALASADKASIVFEDELLHFCEDISLHELGTWLEVFLGRLLSCTQEALQRASLKKEDIERVFLTGGTSLLPSARMALAHEFGSEKLFSGHPFDSVALGLLELVPR